MLKPVGRILGREVKVFGGHISRYRYSTMSNETSRYKQILDEYFQKTKFNIKPENQERNQQNLRMAMDTVYLRQRPLVAIDIEAWERSTKKVTEIGVAIFDPETLKDSILPQIEQMHLVIKEHQRMYNGRFCPDNKKNFMGGKSYLTTLNQAKHLVMDIVDEYINSRNGVFVGHHIEGDISWLKGIGVKIPDNPPIVDTNRLYSLSRRRGATLRGVLQLVDLPHGYLHNAGNDAYYTLLAVMAYTDPKVREAKGLDQFEENIKLSDVEMKVAKFSDRAKLVEVEEGWRGKGRGETKMI